jgi:hypothetical protein
MVYSALSTLVEEIVCKVHSSSLDYHPSTQHAFQQMEEECIIISEQHPAGPE